MGGLEAAEKVLPRLAYVVGKVYKNGFVFSVFRKGLNVGGTLWRSAEHIPTRTEDDNTQLSES